MKELTVTFSLSCKHQTQQHCLWSTVGFFIHFKFSIKKETQLTECPKQVVTALYCSVTYSKDCYNSNYRHETNIKYQKGFIPKCKLLH